MKSSKPWRCSSASIVLGLLGSAGAASADDSLPPQSAVLEEGLRPALFAVGVNGASTGEPVVLLISASGAIYASGALLRAWRLEPWQAALVHDGIPQYPLSGVPGLEMEVVPASQTLLLTAEPRLLQATALMGFAVEMGPMTPSATGGFFNYDVVAQASSRLTGVGGLFELGLFTPSGSAATTFAARADDDETGVTRLETSWTRKDPDAMHFLRLGDSISRGGLGGNPVRFAGVHLARDFTTQPGFVTIPTPTIGGESQVASVVDVYVNNVLTGTRDVPAGPFSIADVPVLTGGGEVQLVVRDLLGRETTVRARYYTSRQLLRRGLDDYSFEAGFLRRDFGRASFDYGAPMASATYRYGFSDGLTGEVHGEVSPDARMGGAGASLALGNIGVLNASTSVSHSRRGVGLRYELGFESRTPFISYGGLAELIDADFVTVGSFGSDRRPPRLTLQAYAGIPLGFGSLNLSLIHRDERDGRGIAFLGAGTSIGLGRWGALTLSARKSLDGSAADALYASYTMPLGAGTSLGLGGELGQDDRARLSLQRSLPAGEGLGFRAEALLGRDPRVDVRLAYQTNFGRYDLDVGVADSRAGVRLGASGGIGLIGDAVFASRRLTDSFAAVRVGDYPGVRVYADNQVVGRTDSSGVAIVPRLRAFESNRLRIELADLPLDAQIDASELSVRPFDRSGVALDFGVRAVRSAMVVLLRESGEPVPAGAWVRIDGSPEPFAVAPGGETYLSGIGLSAAGVASWEGGACRFALRYPDTGEVQPRLGPLTCLENTP